VSLPRLPAGLEPWGEALAVLTPALADGLLPMLHGLDSLIHRHDSGPGTSGPPDGYDGLAARGIPERIVMSEWLLADELPLEFLRRVVNNELLFLAPAFQRAQPRGRVVVLVDNGPDQLGAPRLVQLAALIVLHRRSIRRGAEIVIGALGEDAGTWLEGDLGLLLGGWRLLRSPTQPTIEAVELRRHQLGARDEVWVLAGRELSGGLAGCTRVLQISEGAWGPDGVSELHVELEGDVIELALPSRELSVRALRGSGFRLAGDVAIAGHVAGVRDATFSSQARQLLMRGDDTEVLVVAVPENGPARGTRVRRHRFPGPAVAAAYLGRRMVALTLEDDALRVRVVGKPLGRLDQLIHPTAAVGATPDQMRAACAEGLPPLYYSSQSVICQILGTWWRLSPEHCKRLNYMAAAPGKNVDLPRVACRVARGIWADHAVLPGSADASAVQLGHDGWCALSDDGVHWRPLRGAEAATVIAAGEGATVLALVTEGGEPKLVTASPAGLVLRLVGANGVRTLTHWSGGPGRPTIHPTLPLVAVQRASDLIEIGHLLTGEILQVVRSEP
jgi:hypothetical protein